MTARTFVWTGFIAIAAFMLMAGSRLTLLDPVESVTLDVTSPVQTALSDATAPVADWWNNLTDAGSLSTENEALRTENERLTNELARSREEVAAAANAQDLAEVRAQFPEDVFVPARVIGRDTSNLRSIVAIDRGSADGVKEGMIVVTEGRSLVGKVTKVFDDYAWITLIIDPKSAVSAMVQESRAQGVVSGDYGGKLVMEFVDQGAPVKEGDFVITSGLGGGYPQGVTIGRVSDVRTAEQELFQEVHVDHLASLSDLEQVMVMTNFEPTELKQP